MRRTTIAVDVDEVCADLLSEWLRRYNSRTNRFHEQRLLPEQITDWDLRQFVPKEDQSMIYSILHDEGLYDSIQPIEGARDAVWLLREQGFRVIFVTACVPGTTEAKRRWLNAWGFFAKGGLSDKDFCPVTDKSLIRADYLVDDRYENVRDFEGQGILVNRAHNRHISGYDRIDGLWQLPDWLHSPRSGFVSRGV